MRPRPKRNSIRRTTICVPLVLFIGGLLKAAEPVTVNEVIALVDASVAKVPSARIGAQTTVVTVRPEEPPELPQHIPQDLQELMKRSHEGGTRKFTGVTKVWWKPGSIKWFFHDSNGLKSRRILMLADQHVDFGCMFLGTEKQHHRASDYVVTINESRQTSIGSLHPRWTGVPYFWARRPWSLADMLRDMIQNKVKFSLQPADGGLLKIDAKSEYVRYRYLCDPQWNYYAVSCEEHALLKDGKERPFQFAKTEYQKNADGVVYPKRIEFESYTYYPGGAVDSRKTITDVSEFEVTEIPDSEFTLESLGLPIGARIIDNRNGGEITYFGVEAPSEAALDQLEWKASGPRPGIDWWFWGGVGLGVVGLGVGAWSWRKTRAA